MTESTLYPFGIKPDILSKIIKVLEKYESVEKVLIYGSRATGKYRIGSDIDLNMVGEGLDDLTFVQIENDLDDLLLPYKLDLTAQKHITNQKLLDHISKFGKVIYQRPKKSPRSSKADPRAFLF